MLPDVRIEHELDPIWDEEKDAVFGGTSDAVVLGFCSQGLPIAGLVDSFRASVGNTVVGYAFIYSPENSGEDEGLSPVGPDNSAAAELIVVVRSDNRGMGIGTELLSVAERAAKDRGFPAIEGVVRQSNPSAIQITEWLAAHSFRAPVPVKDIPAVLSRLGTLTLRRPLL